MKSFSGKWMVILSVIGLPIFSYPEVWGADWKLLAQNNDGTYYYDEESLVYPSKSIIRVWIKSIYKSNKHFLTEKYNIETTEPFVISNQSKTLLEINCSERMIRTISSIAYYKGEMVGCSRDVRCKAHITVDFEWGNIVPETDLEVLYKNLCSKRPN